MKLGDIKLNIKPKKEKAAMSPGEIVLRRVERRSGEFFVTVTWCDMFEGTHEAEFSRGDIFADFTWVLKTLTAGGLPLDLNNVEELHRNFCKISTVMRLPVKPSEQKSAVGGASPEEMQKVLQNQAMSLTLIKAIEK